ncbi:hypothetical protein GKZ28_25900 [Clostridium chromiireducens]|uniref:Uncharacterized protein n=1 Tax=Clostridium chromiireducens TaxID=225345 RepID=A0A964W556_9CLOT|nr:hypothetical protein [Clostridium chromiireducens]MVX67089.1 hypothetical protein [Clostridium chromiireducens]
MKDNSLQLNQDNSTKREELLLQKAVKRHPIIAGICDYYLVSIFSGALIALVISIINKTFQYPFIIAIVCNLLALIFSIIYHAVISKKVQWLSPGEIITGRRLIHSEKVWINQHGHNRWIEFTFTIMTFILLGNEWDKLSLGYIFTIGEVLIKTLKISIFSAVLIMFGNGKFFKKKGKK